MFDKETTQYINEYIEGYKEMNIIRTYIHPNNQFGVAVVVVCESTSVAKNEEFIKFVDDLALAIGSHAYEIFYEPTTSEVLFMEDRVHGGYIIDSIMAARKKFGENIRLEKYSLLR
jgi:translation elongation factor EF-Ts